MNYFVANFYKFINTDGANTRINRLHLECVGKGYDIGGLVILAPEGCNGTIAGPREIVENFILHLHSLYGVDGWCNKFSFCRKQPFPKFRVRVRKEIVTSGIKIECSQGREALNAEQWHNELLNPKNIILDVRNDYEVQIGKFQGAINPVIQNFQELPQYLKNVGIERNQKVLIYCTGGIRCEKALVELEQEGFKNIKHLRGGVLSYLEEYPDGAWEGECFVFDQRVALDKFLEPTKNWSICSCCGQPVDIKKSEFVCTECELEKVEIS